MPFYEVKKMKKYIKANNDLSVSAIGKFIDKAVKELEEFGEEDGYSYTYYYDLDPDLRLVIAWRDGFEEDNGHSGYEICGKIATAHDDLVDYEWSFMPYDEETEDVWDTELSNPNSQDAQWYIDQYKAIREAYDNGEVVIPGADEYE